jgi:hypothetical protein
VLAGASNLSRLQSLKAIRIGGKGGPMQLQYLPSSLTALHLTGVVARLAPDGSSSDSTWQLPALRKLTMVHCDVPPPVLLRLPQLQYFSHSVERYSMNKMHRALPHLQQLQTLQLTCFGAGVSAEMFAAVAASSHLTSLVLVSCRMPARAARHMFGAGRLLPRLQQLNTTDDEIVPGAPPGGGPHALETLEDWSLLVEDGDAQRIVDSSPALQSLGTLRVAAGLPHAQLLPLVQLNALTELSIGGAGCTDAASELVLAKLEGGHSCSMCANSCMRVAARYAVHAYLSSSAS